MRIESRPRSDSRNYSTIRRDGGGRSNNNRTNNRERFNMYRDDYQNYQSTRDR